MKVPGNRKQLHGGTRLFAAEIPIGKGKQYPLRELSSSSICWMKTSGFRGSNSQGLLMSSAKKNGALRHAETSMLSNYMTNANLDTAIGCRSEGWQMVTDPNYVRAAR